VRDSGISWAVCKSAPRSRQITTSAPSHLVFYRPDVLPAAQPTAPKHRRHNLWRVGFLQAGCKTCPVHSPVNSAKVRMGTRSTDSCDHGNQLLIILLLSLEKGNTVTVNNIFIKPHCNGKHKMHCITTNVVCSVCLSAAGMTAAKSWTDQDSDWSVDLWGPWNHKLGASSDAVTGRGTFGVILVHAQTCLQSVFSQTYPQVCKGAATMWPFAVITVATCYYISLMIPLVVYTYSNKAL